jgi:DNA-binding CsgD family transcriptional regulator
MNGVTSDDSGASRTVEKGSTMPNEGLFSVEASKKDFGLTPLEKQAIALTVAGYSSEESAKRIGISEPGLGLLLISICDKLHVSNQFELILFALYHQLIDTYDVSTPSDRKARG